MPVLIAAVGRLHSAFAEDVLVPVSLKMNASDDNDLSRHAQII